MSVRHNGDPSLHALSEIRDALYDIRNLLRQEFRTFRDEPLTDDADESKVKS